MIEHVLNKADQILVTTHVEPDGDAIGSLTAFGLALGQTGQRVTLANDDGVPQRFAHLALADSVRNKPDPQVAYDLLIALDCGDAQRMGRVFDSLPNPKPFVINIDHHVTNTLFGDINIVRSDATSTAEILHDLFLELGFTVTKEIAESLLTGLVTDTLGFRTVGVTAETLRIAAGLVEAGANIGQVTMRALNMRSLSTLRLWAIGLDKMQLEDDLLWATITDSERRAVGFRSHSSVGLANLLADAEESAMGVVLMEMSDGTVKVGLRCRPPYDVAEVAVALGGGGHQLASGCTMDGPLEIAETTVVRLCQEAIVRQARAAEVVLGG